MVSRVGCASWRFTRLCWDRAANQRHPRCGLGGSSVFSALALYCKTVRLIAFKAENFRRFVDPSSIKLHSDLVALIGPNEAGKSSILDGLELLHSDDPYGRSDEHRRSGISPSLAWSFQLDDDDKAALAGIPAAGSVQRVVITKAGDGRRRWSFYPSEPTRDRGPRIELADLVERFMDMSIALGLINQSDEFVQSLHQIADKVRGPLEDFESDTINELGTMSADVEAFDLGLTHDELDDESELASESLKLSDVRDELKLQLSALARAEAQPNPSVQAETALKTRLPGIISYKQADRDLRGSYDLEEVADSEPPALKHLRALAGLDLVELRREIREGRRADVTTRRDDANRTLRRAFEKSWNQQKVALQIDLDGTTIFVHAISLSAAESGSSELSERSDGMRWFASLLAFVNGWAEKPILLVDEIETHLHYDAQADLVNVLGRQEFTAKVIYSTHSFGCLPPDLGTGLRLVEPVTETTSRMTNGFWKNGVGFSPLLTSMGAAAVSFTPSRHAVIVEGPSDAILLPTLLRQAMGSENSLGFQVAPGVAEVATAKSRGLTAEAGRVAFLVDGDEGGLRNREKLIEGGVDGSSIVVLASGDGSPLEIEDLIDASVYVKAVNAELACWNSIPSSVTEIDLGTSLRTKALEQWCAKEGVPAPDKVAVAERVIGESTESSVFSSDRQGLLAGLLKKLATCLGVSAY